MRTSPRVLASDIAAINLTLRQLGVKKELRIERWYNYSVLEICNLGKDNGRDIVAGTRREIHCAVMGFEEALACMGKDVG